MQDRERDSLLRFLFEHTHVRGELVRLDASWQAVLERHDYPPAVRELLGQAMAAVALLSATIKFDGSLTLQVHGAGPLNLLVVQGTANRTLRGLAQWQGELVSAAMDALTGEGRMVITIDPGAGRERYQGIVALQGHASLAAALHDYFQRSEQLATRLWLAADAHSAAGLLLQTLPGHAADEDDDAWPRALSLADTLTETELLELSGAEIMRRLFHEEDLRVFESEPVSFRCSCSRERIEQTLRSLGHEDVKALLEERGMVEADCEFCNKHYAFDAVDIERLFAAADQPGVPPTQH